MLGSCFFGPSLFGASSVNQSINLSMNADESSSILFAYLLSHISKVTAYIYAGKICTQNISSSWKLNCKIRMALEKNAGESSISVSLENPLCLG